MESQQNQLNMDCDGKIVSEIDYRLRIVLTDGGFYVGTLVYEEQIGFTQTWHPPSAGKIAPYTN